MVSCCCVPNCSNRIPGHRFPKDPVLKKKWLIAIRRDKFTPNEHTRVCKAHFLPTDYVLPKESVRKIATPHIRPDAVPSKFAWTSSPSQLVKSRRERAARRLSAETTTTNSKSKKRKLFQEDERLPQFPDNSISEEIPSNVFTEVQLSEPTNTVEMEVDCPLKDLHVQCNLISAPDDTKEKSNVEVQTVSSRCEKDFDIEDLKDKPSQVLFYTGFSDYNHFMLVFNSFGGEVNHLKYYPSMSIAKAVRSLSPANEFFLTCIRLRRAKLFEELGYMFGICSSTASNIYITWINFLNCKFEEVQLIRPFSVIEKNMLLRGMDCSSTIILDCTEIKIQQPKNPVQQQQTYSTYKSCNTVKVLVAITPSGSIVYGSPAYGGSISDRDLFERSGLINLLQENDVILCDRGFNIQDLVASKNITVSMPEFMQKGKGQFTPAQRLKSMSVSNKRIHVERFIGLAKTYLILQSKFPSSQVQLASRIVFVCFMLANLRPNIILSYLQATVF